ncbi:Protein of unknown function [Lactobacillus helveticus CIRM-BIA 101]|nr:Protein of unknown function [Lactobacillus helveticus CIRM-BIA 104]CDI64241.1 Protein of unknown function [Lactobacillus helveticus CIRM-BIA 101]
MKFLKTFNNSAA